jgi:hypothetical protein
MSTVGIEEETSTWQMPTSPHVLKAPAATFENAVCAMFILTIVIFIYSLKRQT